MSDEDDEPFFAALTPWGSSTYSNMPTSTSSLVREGFEKALAELRAGMAEDAREPLELPRRPEVIGVPPASWARMQAVKREFPKATDLQALGAAHFAKDDDDAIRAFARWHTRGAG